MSSIVWHLGDGRPVDPGRLYQVRGGAWAEPMPIACPAGHQLGPGEALVGTVPCLAAEGHHRTYCCRRCGVTIYWPPVNARCDHWGDARAVPEQ